ncbi:MAG: hypothetical protein AAGM38_09635 [Pseudomonadota bacterium]
MQDGRFEFDWLEEEFEQAKREHRRARDQRERARAAARCAPPLRAPLLAWAPLMVWATLAMTVLVVQTSS